MTTQSNDHATQANHRLIAQVAEYYNDTRINLGFYTEINSTVLQEICREHLQHWKNELISLIFNGLNCTDREVSQ